MESIISMVKDVGFPIFITVYLLIRMEIKIDQLTISIHELARQLENSK